MTVKRVSLSEEGPEVSEMAWGTWRLLDEDPEMSSTEVALRLERCLGMGITTIDTAEIYGEYRVEEALGRGLAASADFAGRFEIVTKAGIDVPSAEKPHARLPHYNATEENLVACAEKSLRLLGVDVLDIFLVHRPDWFARAEETAAGLERLLAEGKIRFAGVSNYTPPQFDLLSSLMSRPLVTNQVEVNLLAMDALYDGTLAQCEQHRIRPMAWSVLGGGELFSDSEAARRIRDCAGSLSGKYGDAGIDALATAWVMNHPSRPVGITGSNKPERIASQVEAAGIRLDRQDWYALWSAARGQPVP